MRILLACGVLVAAISAPAGCSRSGDAQDATAASTKPAPPIPTEADIFAVAVWTRTPERLKALVAKESTQPSSHPAAAQAPYGAAQTPGACWLSVPCQDEYWKGKFSVTDNDVRERLMTYHRVTPEQWKNLSHVAGGDTAGWLILNNGNCIQWTMKPGGLGWLRFSTGEMIYLSKTVPP